MDHTKLLRVLEVVTERVVNHYRKIEMNFDDPDLTRTEVCIRFANMNHDRYEAKLVFFHASGTSSCRCTRNEKILCEAVSGTGDAASESIFTGYPKSDEGDLTYTGGIRFLIHLISVGVISTEYNPDAFQAYQRRILDIIEPLLETP